MNIIELLDSRYEDRVKKGPINSGVVAKKVRKVGEPSHSKPPHDAQSWAIVRDRIPGNS